MAVRLCVDCFPPPRVPRSAPHPGPRCTTHHREVKAARAARAHDLRVARTYDLKPGDYKKLLDAQHGLCWICGPTTGNSGQTKRLPVDHNHRTGEARGLLCGNCNEYLGRIMDDPVVGDRLAEYLRNPPARKILGWPR